MSMSDNGNKASLPPGSQARPVNHCLSHPLAVRPLFYSLATRPVFHPLAARPVPHPLAAWPEPHLLAVWPDPGELDAKYAQIKKLLVMLPSLFTMIISATGIYKNVV